MRVKLTLNTMSKGLIPYDYQYQLHSAVYGLVRKSSPQYSEFLHDIGFIDNNKHLKLFVFSKIFFENAIFTSKDIKNVDRAYLCFSTPIPRSFEHLILGIFSDQKLQLNFAIQKTEFLIEMVETLPEPVFEKVNKFTCLSPIAVAGNSETQTGKHYLDYLNPGEREKYVSGIKNNLLRKYRLVNNSIFCGDEAFDFSFDPLYIVKKQGKIRKNIKFKEGRIIGMEAPFTIKADPELIKIGYECGLGSENSAGFGMVEAYDMEYRRVTF